MLHIRTFEFDRQGSGGPAQVRHIVSWRAVAVLVSCALVPSIGHAADYKSLGVTRAAVIQMLTQQELNPSLNSFPPFEGHPVTSATVYKPYIDFEMIGPDDGLNEITLTVRPTKEQNDSYWHSYVSLWLLNAVFPDWPNREEWWNGAILSDERIEFSRNGYDVTVARGGVVAQTLLFLVISGQELD